MSHPNTPVTDWHARPIPETASLLTTDLERGLSATDAARRMQRAGRNEIPRARKEPWWGEVAEALTEPLVLLLLAVAVLYALLGERADAITIFAVILAVVAVEIANEARAKRAIAALRTLSEPTATVVRDGQSHEIPATDVVPGDLMLLAPGRRIPADLRLIETVALRVDESSLTGESTPVMKRADTVLSQNSELGDRCNLAFSGTVVSAGKGRGLAVATGRETELGRVTVMTEAVRESRTPLQQYLRQLSGWLVWLAIGFSLLVPVLGVLVAGQPWREMVLTGLTLAFATIPEELPILIVIVLGIGAYHLTRQQAIVRRLQAAETLGSVSVIGTDKTGTLTENRMRVTKLFVDGVTQNMTSEHSTPSIARLIEIGVLANDALVTGSDDDQEFAGDPTETALLAAAQGVGVDVAALRATSRVVEEYPFDDVRKRMSVVYERDGERWLVTKGAPESVLAMCSNLSANGRNGTAETMTEQGIMAVTDQLAADGLRVLAFAERRLAPGSAPVESNLCFVGLAGLEDPPRPEAAPAIALLKAAGVRALMLTGDHPATARAIAERVGIDASVVVVGRELEQADEAQLARLVNTASVFARIAPEHKLRIVRALQAQGAVVAVTGDGINDAPALREAAIGIAMGRSGTDVAREAADLVLADDNFATVTAAVRTGRTLYANLYKAVRYYLAAKVALISASLGVVLAGLPVPFAPVQIIVMELFMDLGASMTFVAEPAEEDVMARPPRSPQQSFMDRPMQIGIFAGGLSLAAAVASAYAWVWYQDLGIATAQSAAFVTWMVGHLVLAAHMRSERQPLLRTRLMANRPFLLWGAAVVLLVTLGMNLPFLQDQLHLAPLPATTWAVVLAAGVLIPSWWELVKWVHRFQGHTSHSGSFADDEDSEVAHTMTGGVSNDG